MRLFMPYGHADEDGAQTDPWSAPSLGIPGGCHGGISQDPNDSEKKPLTSQAHT